MKNLIIVFLLIGILSVCSKDESFDFEKYPQKWKLIKMTFNSFGYHETTGKDMIWQESILLNSKGTFTKSRERNGIIVEESGNFSFEHLNDGRTHIVLTYAADNDLIENCGGLQEIMFLESSKNLVGGSSPCDGPGLEYERIE